MKIIDVEKGSPAADAGIKAGDMLISINRHIIKDGLDYEFYSSEENLSLEYSRNGEASCLRLKKEQYRPLGLIFSSYLIDKQHSCKNKCMFCFIDQMPKGMRESLYFKDDDERLSFLFGNYITLTNLREEDIQRIIDMRIQPINISVHTMNPALRVEIMKNPRAGECLAYINRLAGAGISMNSQLVLMPGINDGDELKHSIEELAKLRPAMESLAAVPVGLSRFREGLPEIKAYNRQTASQQLDIMLEYGNRFEKDTGERFIYPSDEWFLLAGRDIPPESFYGSYAQLENGVGMWRLFHDDFMYEIENGKNPETKVEIDIVSGSLSASLMKELAQAVGNKFTNVKMNVHVVENDFFGRGVTVSGLLTAEDIICQLKSKVKSGVLVLPSSVFRSDGDLTLDGKTAGDMEKALGVKLIVNTGGAKGLADILLGISGQACL